MRHFPDSPITTLIDSKPLYNLGESTGPDLALADLLGSDGVAGLGGVRLGYGTSAGDPALRALVAARHGIADDRVLITAGAAAGLFLTALLWGDGDILVGLPCYPPMLDALRGLGGRIVTLRSRFEDGYRVDLDAFARTLTARTSLVMLASPQNPSGVSITGGEVEQMLAAMASTCPRAVLLIDETYREASYPGVPPAASFAGTSPRLLTCGTLSKAYGVPGLRIGWLTVPSAQWYDQLRLAKFNSALACGTLDEFFAVRLLVQADQVLEARGELMAEALGTTERWLAGQSGGLRWLRPEAGAFCCVQLDPDAFGPDEVERFHASLEQQQTRVARGPWFGDSASIFRIGLAYEQAGKFEMGLAAIGAALAAARTGLSVGDPLPAR
jgi:aspartate/methionine/tyrosine aminotransferase